MVMFLTIILTSFAVLVVTCIMVAGLSPQERKPVLVQPELRPQEKLALTPPQFFAGEVTELPPPPARPQIPLEVLLSQIQRHVRLEQAAAETFINVPTPESLHSRTASPFVN